MSSIDVIGKNETEVTRQELIVAMVQRALREQAQLVPTVRDVSSFAQEGLDAINFPRRKSKFTVQNLEEDSEANTQAYEYDLDKLELNQHAIINWFIKKRSNAQSMVDLEADAIMEAAAEHAIDVDRKLMDAMIANAASDNDVSVSGDFTKSKLLEIKAKLQKSTKLNPRNAAFYLLVNSDRESELLDIAGFVEADKYGSDQPVTSGELGRLYGMRVLITDEPNLGENQALGYVQQGIAYGNQLAPDFNELYIPKKAGTDYALDQLYGVKVLDEGKYISKVTFTA